MKYMSVVLSGLIVMLVLPHAAHSQAQTGDAQPAPNAPLELPDFLVTGKAVVDIAAGVKQSPQKPARFSTSDLDSLNPTEKFPGPAVPNRSLPRFSRTRLVRDSYIDASFGMYTSPILAAGTSLTMGEYRIDADADGSFIKDWQPNARALDAGLALSSTYVAPEKFYLFGKGLTETDVLVRHRNYSLFAIPSAPTRSTTRMHAGVGTEASLDGRPIVANLSWNNHIVSDASNASISDQRIHGDIASSIGRGLTASVALDLQSRAAQSYPFVSATVSKSFGDTSVRVSANLGGQFATSTQGQTRVGFLADVAVGFEPNEFYTFGASVRTGLRQIGYSDLLHINPYVSASTLIDLPYDIADVGLFCKYHPTQHFNVLLGAGVRQTTRNAVWVDTLAGVFDVEYHDVTALSARIELQYLPSLRDRLLVSAVAQSAITSKDASVPYTEPVRVDVAYRRVWFQGLATKIAAQYVGKRWSDINNSRQIDAFLNLQANVSYEIAHGMDIVVNADNLINSTIIQWNGYRERGIFVAAGISWRL